MKKKLPNSKKKLYLTIVLAIVTVAIVWGGLSMYGSEGTPSIFAQTGFTQFSAIGTCPSLSLETTCQTINDCYDKLPSDMPESIDDVGSLSCVNGKCFITYDTCGEGIYEP